MHWIKISCILCMFGCFKDFRPSESFVTDYLTGRWKNFTESEVNQDIYPVATYSYLTTLILIFLITDFLRYKPIIILCGLSGVTSFLLLILGKTVLMLQIVEFFYGLFLSAEVAYYTYIYAKVNKEHYQEVTGYTKAASLFGRSMAGVIAQLTASFDLLDYHQLHYLTLGASAAATVWSLFLPSVGQSIYFHPTTSISNGLNSIVIGGSEVIITQDQECVPQESLYDRKLSTLKYSLLHKIRNAYALLWKHFLQAFTNYYVIKWSAWWALSTCGYLQVANYMQLLWKTAVEPGDEIYNGAVDFLYAIIGAVTVFYVGKLRINWALLGDMAIAVFALLEAVILLASSYSYDIWFLYAGYIIFGVFYHTMVTVASFEVAKYISEDSYSLIFGVNIFFALAAESLLTLIVINTLQLDIRQQFFVYGGYFLTLAVIYVILGLINCIQRQRNAESFHLWINGDNESSTQNANCESNTGSLKPEDNCSMNYQAM